MGTFYVCLPQLDFFLVGLLFSVVPLFFIGYLFFLRTLFVPFAFFGIFPTWFEYTQLSKIHVLLSEYRHLLHSFFSASRYILVLVRYSIQYTEVDEPTCIFFLVDAL